MSKRRIAATPTTLAALAAHRERMTVEGWTTDWTAPMFCDTAGGLLRKTNLPYQVLVKKAGVPRIRFHDLRHSSGTQLPVRGINIKAVSVRLGDWATGPSV